MTAALAGTGKRGLGSGIGKTESRKRTWLRGVVKRRREGSTRRRVVLPATRRRGDGVNWMEVMAFP